MTSDLLWRGHDRRRDLGVLPREYCSIEVLELHRTSPADTSNQVPETKGRTLEEMDELFGSGDARFAAEDAARKERIEREVGLTALLSGDSSSGEGKFDSVPENREYAGKTI